MKIKTSELVDKHNVLSHLILNCMNKETNNLVTSNSERTLDTEYDITLTFEGIELDIRKFTKLLDDEHNNFIECEAKNQAKEEFEKFVHKYKSENSKGMKLEKINKQFDKVSKQFHKLSNQLQNIQDDIQKLK